MLEGYCAKGYNVEKGEAYRVTSGYEARREGYEEQVRARYPRLYGISSAGVWDRWFAGGCGICESLLWWLR